MTITGDNITPKMKDERALVILNHRTRYSFFSSFFVIVFFLTKRFITTNEKNLCLSVFQLLFLFFLLFFIHFSSKKEKHAFSLFFFSYCSLFSVMLIFKKEKRKLFCSFLFLRCSSSSLFLFVFFFLFISFWFFLFRVLVSFFRFFVFLFSFFFFDSSVFLLLFSFVGLFKRFWEKTRSQKEQIIPFFLFFIFIDLILCGFLGFT